MTTPSLRSATPVVIFDGDCGICTTLAGFARRRVRPAAAIEPWQQLDLAALGVSAEQCVEALQFVDTRGRVFAAELAVSQLLRAAPPAWRPLGWLIAAPGVRPVAGLVYRWVARNRYRLPGGTPACALPPSKP